MPSRKKNKLKKKEAPELPVNSFADIAFLLIVFFVIASTLTQTKGIITDIPAGEKSTTQQEKTTTVKLNGNVFYLNDKPIELTALRKALHKMKLNEKEGEAKIILLDSSGDVNYQDYFSAMTAISGAGGVMTIVKEGEDE